MKVGIITISDGENYGNRLQNYALQEVLKEIGVEEVETIRNPIKINKDEYKVRQRIIRNIKSGLKIVLRKSSYQTEKCLNNRKRIFRKFTISNIKLSKRVIARDFLPAILEKEYDFFIVGSDQVWNPNFPNITDIDFLTFASYEKRIAYAASFGVTEIPLDREKKYKENLMGIRRISVREESAACIVERLTKKEVEVVLDPTLLLSTKKWRSLSRKPKQKLPEKYVLGYFLNGGTKEEKEKVIKKASEMEAEPLFLTDLNSPDFYALDPFEFLWCIDHALCLYTNSFHGTVFSILFHTPFLCLLTKGFNDDMSTRFETLFNFCKIGNMFVNEIMCTDQTLDQKLEKPRNVAKEYLKKSLYLK